MNRSPTSPPPSRSSRTQSDTARPLRGRPAAHIPRHSQASVRRWRARRGHSPQQTWSVSAIEVIPTTSTASAPLTPLGSSGCRREETCCIWSGRGFRLTVGVAQTYQPRRLRERSAELEVTLDHMS